MSTFGPTQDLHDFEDLDPLHGLISTKHLLKKTLINKILYVVDPNKLFILSLLLGSRYVFSKIESLSLLLLLLLYYLLLLYIYIFF